MGDFAKQTAARAVASVANNGFQQSPMASSANRQVTPIGLRAIGFGLLGAALAMGVFETLQMMHVLPSVRTVVRRCSMLTFLQVRASERQSRRRAHSGKNRRSKSSDRSELARTEISTEHEPVSSQSARRGQPSVRLETSIESILSTATASSIAAASRLAVLLQQSGYVICDKSFLHFQVFIPFSIRLSHQLYSGAASNSINWTKDG